MCSHNLVGFHLNYFFIMVNNSKNSLIYSKVMRNPVSFVSVNIQNIMRKNHFITDDKVVPVDFGRCEKYSGSFSHLEAPLCFSVTVSLIRQTGQRNRFRVLFPTLKNHVHAVLLVLWYIMHAYMQTRNPHTHTNNEPRNSRSWYQAKS